MTDNEAAASFAAQRRRESRREEFTEQTRLARLLEELLDPADTFFSALENRPRSPLSGVFQRKKGVKSGLADLMVISSGRPIFVELKSRAGVASKQQRRVAAQLRAAGATYWLARTASAALKALQLSGVIFRCPWEPPRLEPWMGPFADPTQRLPQEPGVAAQRRATTRAWRERQRARRAAEAATLAAASDDAASDDIAV